MIRNYKFTQVRPVFGSGDTANPRIAITFEDKEFLAIRRLAEAAGVPFSAEVRRLVKLALWGALR